MLNSYLQNLNAGVNKNTYFEICEALGTEPVEEEIPVELSDLPIEIQEVINIYFKLKDEWDTMNGIYLGKSYAGLSDILDILEVEFEDRKYYLEWFSVLDTIRSKIIKESRPKQDNPKTP